MSTMCIDTSSLDDKIKSIAQAGFDSIELWTKDVKNVKELKKKLNDLQLIPAEMAKIEGWFELDGSLMGVEDNKISIIDECKRRIEITAELGCPYIVAVPSRNDRGRFQSIEKGAEIYNELLEIGRSFNVCPTLEFIGQSTQINNIEKTLNFLKIVNNDFAKIVVDIFHIWRSGDEIESFLKVPVEKISLLHLHDVSKEYSREVYKDRHRIMPGDGILDITKFIQIAKEKNFVGDVSLGVYNHENWKRSPFDVTIEGYSKMKRFLK